MKNVFSLFFYRKPNRRFFLGKAYVGGILMYLCCLGQTTELYAQLDSAQVGYRLVESLDNQWLIYDQSYGGYVPYFRKTYGLPSAVSLYLNLKKYHAYHLLLETKEPTHLFVQSQLCRTLAPTVRTILDIDSLRQYYKTDFVLVSVYRPEGHTPPPTAQIIYSSSKKAIRMPQAALSEIVTRKVWQPRLRESSDFQDFIVVLSVVLLAFYTFLFNYHPKAFGRNFGFRSILSIDTREDATIVAKPLSQINILFILAHSMLLGMFYMIAQRYSDSFFVNILSMEASDTFRDLGKYFGALTGLFFILLIGKYLFIYAIGVVFGINNTASVHYYEYLLFSRLFFVLFVPVQFILLVVYPQWMLLFLQVSMISFILLNIARILTISSVLNKMTTFRNLYLFSYLCATELIPLLMGIKLLDK